MDSATFILFGATGDLAKRKLFPALFSLYSKRRLPDAFSIIALGRKGFAALDFQDYVARALHTYAKQTDEAPGTLSSFLACFRYYSLDVTDTAGYVGLLRLIQERERELDIPENRLFYLSVAPEFFHEISYRIKESGLGNTKGWKRLVIEKPFGHDLQSAIELHEKMSGSFEEHEIYRIDHYLGKPMVQKLHSVIANHPQIGALWNRNRISNVQITASETVGVEGRGDYYERAGAIRDMFQNHMLQLLMMIAMRFPAGRSADETIARKCEVLQALRPISKAEAALHIVRGQYTAGTYENITVAPYRDEPRVQTDSMTDTFVAARLWIDNEQWSNIPFYIRTGKRMKEKLTAITIEFEPKEGKCGDGSSSAAPDRLEIRINPDERVFLHYKDRVIQQKTDAVARSDGALSDAYERLLLDALRGDATYFTHWEEVELSWKWVQPVLEAFAENRLPLHTYPAGTSGPAAANTLTGEQGHAWWQYEEMAPRKIEELI